MFKFGIGSGSLRRLFSLDRTEAKVNADESVIGGFKFLQGINSYTVGGDRS